MAQQQQQQQYEFSIDEAVQKWRTLTADKNVLLENEFKVCSAMLSERFVKKNREFLLLETSTV